MTAGQFRILPLLIFVAMLAFSVRLAEFVTGVRHFSASAIAAEATDKNAEPPPIPDAESKPETTTAATDAKPTEEKPEGETKSEEKPAESTDKEHKEEDGHTEVAEDGNKKLDAPEWRDAGDSDLDIKGVKMDVMEDVSRRSAKLDAQEKGLKTREALLKATEQEIDRKYQELTKLRTEIEGLLGKQSEEEEKRLVSLVKIYEGMKPKEAARIFDTLDLDILVSVVSKMSERKIAPILGIMDPERAKTLTIMLAEQKQLPSLSQ